MPQPSVHAGFSGAQVATWLLVAVFTLLAAWLRFDRLDLMEYKADEAEMMSLASAHTRGQFVLAGMRSGQGVRNPPVAVHIFSWPRFFTSDPLALASLPAALGVLAVPLCFLVTRESFGWRAGLAAALLLATSPWAVLYSRKIWAQDLLPFFTLLIMACAFRLVRLRRPLYAVGFCALLSLMIQVHYSALALAPLGLVLMAWVRGRRFVLAWAAGAALVVLTLIPFLVHQARHDFEDFRLATRAAGQQDIPPAGPWRAALYQAEMLSFGGFDYPLGPAWPAFRQQAFAWPGAPVAANLLLALGFATAVVRARRDSASLLLALWMALPVLAWSLVPPVTHYQIIALPAPFIALGLLIEALAPKPRAPEPAGAAQALPALRRAGQRALAAALILLAAANTLFFTSFLDFIEAQGGGQGDYGMAYRYQLDVAQRVASQARGQRWALADYTSMRLSPEVLGSLASPLGAGSCARSPVPGAALFCLYRANSNRTPRLPPGCQTQPVGPFKLARLPAAPNP